MTAALPTSLPLSALENAAEAVKLLFTGAHDGKLLVRISPEP